MNIYTFKAMVRKNRLLYGILFPLIALRRQLNPKAKLDKAYHQLFEGVRDGSLVVSMPRYGGDIEFDFRSHILRRLMRDKDYEPEFAEIVRKHLDPRKDAIDVGANNGAFSVLMSSLVISDRRVLSVEPTPGALRYLRRNLARNERSNVIVFEGVASNEKGKLQINTVPGMEEYSSLRKDIAHGTMVNCVSTSVEVEASTVDALVEQHGLEPGFIKIDTEGAEFMVLSGAVEVLKKFRPIILAELVDDYLSGLSHSSRDVIDLLHRHGYKVVDAELPGRPIEYPFTGEVLAFPAQLAGK